MLKLTNVSKTFNAGTVDEHISLDNVSLTVNDADFISVIGANGAGKTTLFNAISGTFLCDSGTVELNGTDITLMHEHIRAKKIGRLFQDPMKGTAPGMTVEENLALAAGSGGWFSHMTAKDRAFFRDKLAALNMGLEDRMNASVGLLSGGQRQALTLVMATINPPEILLLDEHTAALDPGTADKVLALTKSIVEESALTCMMITHNMQSALDLGTRTLMMNNGRIVLDVSGAERSSMTVSDLLARFKAGTGENLTTDRILLS